DDDAERLLRMEERLLPARVGVVIAHDRVAVRLRAVAHLAQARDQERHVVDSAPALSEEAMEEPVGATWLQDLEAAAVLEAPLPERIRVRKPTVRRRSAQVAHEERRSVGHPRNGDGDVVEADPSHRELAEDGDPVALD